MYAFFDQGNVKLVKQVLTLKMSQVWNVEMNASIVSLNEHIIILLKAQIKNNRKHFSLPFFALFSVWRVPVKIDNHT